MYTSAKPYFYGTGRRKSSVARVRIYTLNNDGSLYESLYNFPTATNSAPFTLGIGMDAHQSSHDYPLVYMTSVGAEECTFTVAQWDTSSGGFTTIKFTSIDILNYGTWTINMAV